MLNNEVGEGVASNYITNPGIPSRGEKDAESENNRLLIVLSIEPSMTSL